MLPGGFGAYVAGKLLGPGLYLELPIEPAHLPSLISEARSPDKAIEVEVRLRLSADPAFPFIHAGDQDVTYTQNEFSGGGRVVTTGLADGSGPRTRF